MTVCEGMLEAVRAWQPECEEGRRHRDFIARFAETQQRPFDRAAHLDAHLTGSAIVVTHDGACVLLGHHRKLGRWLQLGGHGDANDTDALAVALREVWEESGIEGVVPHPAHPGLLDLDVHQIPARGSEPAHLHLDLRYLLRAPAGAEPRAAEAEHHAVRWFTWDELGAVDTDASLRRSIALARRVLVDSGAAPARGCVRP